MAQMTIRALDDAIMERLKERARHHHRSLEAEVRVILEAAARPDRAALVQRANQLHRALAGRYAGDVTAEVRADRDR